VLAKSTDFWEIDDFCYLHSSVLLARDNSGGLSIHKAYK